MLAAVVGVWQVTAAPAVLLQAAVEAAHGVMGRSAVAER